MVEGRTADGRIRRVSIGVRRDPDLTTSDTKSVPLVRAFLRVVTEHWDEVAAGRWRVALAVGVASTAVRETDLLASIAQSVPSAAEFRDAVDRPAATNAGVRGRLAHLDALVAAAAFGDPVLALVDAKELTWRWLSALRVRKLRLEGADESDRTTAVSMLRRVVAEEATETADRVFAALAEKSGAWAASAARVNQALVRRALSGYPLARSSSYGGAWSVLDGLGRRLREGIRADLSASGVRLELERAEERGRLADAMTNAGRMGAALVVTGEPDVGKSALTLRAAEQLALQGAAVISLSLRDLPSSVAQAERLLGHGSMADVLAATEISPVRLLLLDGAEAVLEGRRDLLRELTTAALRNGIGVVAVTRTDGSKRVQEVLQDATSVVGGAEQLSVHTVARLSPAERLQLVETFQSLIRLSADARAEWLVGRPGLVDALLRAGTVTETTDLLSEADVFAAVWNGLIRNNEEHEPDSPSPDDREEAVLAVARATLKAPGGTMPTGTVRARLRSDGVLRPPANPALAAGDEFATDLVRDFALCRLFLTVGWEPLWATGAPRWAIRAVRLACQAKLLTADRAAGWSALRSDFDELGESDGQRWAELPIEALLTLGDAQKAIEDLWDNLAADGHKGVQTLLRLAHLRYGTDTVADPFALAPVVAVTFCGDHDLGQHHRHSRQGMGGTVRKLVLAWLRGMARDNRGPDQLRQQVRDRILAADPERYDGFAVEALAMLGPDADDRTQQWLKDLAATEPGRLEPAIESSRAVLSLAQSDAPLLLGLTEAYYIDHPTPDGDSGWGLRDNGIRDYRHGQEFGFGPPFAAWYYGPFFGLMNKLPADTFDMINRMLDHAAATRVRRGMRYRAVTPELGQALDGLDLDIPGIGPRHYVGDSHVWGWYRGSTVGPYPCISALMAVERTADHLIRDLSIPVKSVVELLMRGCNNLAMAGLVVGLLIRHLDAAGTLLDPWLTSPALWELEFSRSAAESRFHGRESNPDEAAGRRRLTPRDAAAEMTLRAMVAGDQSRLDQLAAVADQLLANAQAMAADDGSVHLVVVQSWASVFRPENYHTRRAPDGSFVMQYQPPAPIAEALAPSAADFRTGNEALRLELTYTDYDHRDAWPVDTLLTDIGLARRLAANPPTSGPLNPEDPVAAVAAAAVRSHACGQITVPYEDLQWTAATLLTAAANQLTDGMSTEATTYPMAADRSAAKAVPSLLLPPFDGLDLDAAVTEDALTTLATSLYDEVRTAFAIGCAPVWSAPCTDFGDGTLCRRHEPLWSAVQAGLGDCRMGSWNTQTQSRDPQFLPPPYTDNLPTVPASDLLVNRLAMPIASTFAARSTPCLTGRATALLPVLLDAHLTGTDHWMSKGYAGYQDPERELVARVLLHLAAHDEPEPLTAHLQTFAANANALQQLLHDFALLFTYHPQLRAMLPSVWPLVLETTLDAIDAGADLRGGRGHWADYALGALLPTPRLRSSDTHPDDSLDGARRDWIAPEALGGLAQRWISLVGGEPKAADALAQFACTASRTWQCTVGLAWLDRIIDGRAVAFANRCWFVTHWLAELREQATLDASTLKQWRRIIDALAAAGDSRAVDLQQIDE